MKLYYHPVSTVSRPVVLFAADNGIALDLQVVDLMTGEHMKEPYGAINPSRLVPVLEDGDFRIDPSTREVAVIGESIHLTPKEFDLLVFLFRNRGKVVTHRAILTAIWGGNFTEQTEYLRVFVGQLRKKIEVNPSQPRYITTEPWVGYRFLTSRDAV